MSREYRELAGLSPGSYRVEAADVAFVQDPQPLTWTNRRHETNEP
jgi:hypothetical protein